MVIEQLSPPEPQPYGPDGNFAGFEQQFAPQQDPTQFLRELPSTGFVSEAHREVVITQIVAVGLPLDNYQSLRYAPNQRGHENKNWLGSWWNTRGQFSLYELISRQIPEKRLGVVAHESAHAATPLHGENAYLFGGEPQRAAAVRYAGNLAHQSLKTRAYLDGYHAHLARKLRRGKIDMATFTEETQAIATELALTNRAKLEQVEASQHRRVKGLTRLGLWNPRRRAVNLLSQARPDGRVTVDGIDTQLITLLRGVSDYPGLLDHVARLKDSFYPEPSRGLAEARRQPAGPGEPGAAPDEVRVPPLVFSAADKAWLWDLGSYMAEQQRSRRSAAGEADSASLY